MILKLIGYGYKDYFKDKFNLFDAFIVLVSTVDILILYSGLSNNSRGFTVLRAFRILRLLKIVKSWSKL